MPTPPIRSYKNGFYASNTDEYTRPPNEGVPKIDPPNLLSFVPPVPNCIGKNAATSSGFDTLSSGSNQSDTASALIGILSSPAYGQHWGCRDVTGVPGLSAVGVLWDLPGGQSLASGGGAGSSSAGVVHPSTTTRVLILSTPNESPPYLNHRNTELVTSISAAIDIAVVFRDGFTATYNVSADADMKSSTGHGTGTHYFARDKGLSATGNEYKVEKNVGPNIRRLVQLGYR